MTDYPQKLVISAEEWTAICATSSMAEHQTFNLGSSGSSPEWHTYPTIEESAYSFSSRRNNDRIKLNKRTDYKKVQGV